MLRMSPPISEKAYILSCTVSKLSRSIGKIFALEWGGGTSLQRIFLSNM